MHCMLHRIKEPFLNEAFCSVAIENGRRPYDLAVDYFETYHKVALIPNIYDPEGNSVPRSPERL